MRLTLPAHIEHLLASNGSSGAICSEVWAAQCLPCMFCGSRLAALPASFPASDVICENRRCAEQFQVKARKGALHKRSVPGAHFETTVASVIAGQHPHLVLISYTLSPFEVTDLRVVHGSAVTAAAIKRRNKPVPRRPRYFLCKLLLPQIPRLAFVDVVRSGRHVNAAEMKQNWGRVSRVFSGRTTWTSLVARVVERLPDTFDLSR